MDRESVKRLQFDQRLQSRRGWVEESDHQAHLESLPDLADKMTTAAELEVEARSDEGGASAPPADGRPPVTDLGGGLGDSTL